MGSTAQVSAGASAAPSTTSTATDPGPNYGGMALTAAGGISTAYAHYVSGQQNNRIAKLNAKLANQQAGQAVQAGQFAANRVAEHARQIEATERASQGAGGTVVGAGTSRFVNASTEAAADMDRRMIELNARREAFGFQSRAAIDRFQGKQAAQTGDMAAISTLMNTGSQEWLEADPSYRGYHGSGIQFG